MRLDRAPHQLDAAVRPSAAVPGPYAAAGCPLVAVEEAAEPRQSNDHGVTLGSSQGCTARRCGRGQAEVRSVVVALSGAGAGTIHMFPSTETCGTAMDAQWVDEPASDGLSVRARRAAWPATVWTLGDGSQRSTTLPRVFYSC
jgi:hypothetical protein